MSSRWVLYLRLSEQDDASTSISRQEAALRARVQREGGEVVEVFADDGFSGRKRREKADAALAMLRDGEADTLGVWALDRWTRQGLSALSELLKVLDTCPGTRFVADVNGLDSNQPTWDIQVGVLAGVAKMESDNTKTRVRSAIAALRHSKRFAGGTVPWGYRTAPQPDGPGRVLVVDPAEAAIVDEVADRILGGESPWRIARELNERGIPAPRSEFRKLAREGRSEGDRGEWTVTGLKKVMTGVHLLGRQRHGGDFVRDADGIPARVWPPVLDDERWHRLQDLLQRAPGYERPQRRRAARLLSGVASCAECGAKLYVRDDKLSKGGAAYGCPAKQNGRRCPGVRIGAGSLEEYVVGQVMAVVGDWPLMREEVHINERGGTSLAEIEQAIRDTTAALARDDADVPALLTRLAALKVRRGEVRALPALREVRLVPTGRTYGQAFKDAEGDIDEQRMLIADLVLGVRVRKATVQSGKFDPRRVVIDWPES